MKRTPHHFASVFLRRRDGGRDGREVTGWRMDADRDRGTPHGVAPPTPPGIRVRTTAVRPGKQSGPLERRQSERGEERAGKRPAECGGESDAPRSAVAASREVGVLAVHPAFAQLAVAGARTLPLLPDDGAQAPPNPLVKATENRRRLAIAGSTPANPTGTATAPAPSGAG